MKAFLASILSVIAVGVLLIAYGLFNPRSARATVEGYPGARPMLANEQVAMAGVPYNGACACNGFANGPAGLQPVGYPNDVRAIPAYQTYPATPNYQAVPVAYQPQPAYQTVERRVSTARPVRTQTRVVERSNGRSWKKTALVVGGSTATGAGIGALVGGKKGALIGAAIGGGASTLWEAKKR